MHQVPDAAGVETARHHVEDRLHGGQYRIEGPGVTVDQGVAQRRDPTVGLVAPSGRGAEDGGDDGSELFQLGAQHRDLVLSQGGVVAQETQDDISKHLDLSGATGCGVYLEGAVDGGRGSVRRCGSGPDVGLDATQQGVATLFHRGRARRSDDVRHDTPCAEQKR